LTDSICICQRWQTYGTRAQSGTRDDFAWHAQVLHSQLPIALQRVNSDTVSML